MKNKIEVEVEIYIKDEGFGLKFDDEIITEGIILDVEKELKKYPTKQIINDIEKELKDYLIGFGREESSYLNSQIGKGELIALVEREKCVLDIEQYNSIMEISRL